MRSMDQNFEQDIPMGAIVAGFVVLMVVSTFLRRWLRRRQLIKQGQLQTERGRIPTIEERIAGNRAWAKGEILSKGRTSTIVLLIAALAMSLLLVIAFIKSLFNPSIKTAPLIILGIFTAIALVFAVLAIRAAIRYFRFGQSRCCIPEKAGVLGKKLEGVIRTNSEINPSGDYTIELQCLETYTTGSGKNSRTEVITHWQSKQQVSHQGKNPKLGVPFSFELPNTEPETGYQLARGSVDWRLKIHAPVKGVDYCASFIVPVFKMDYSK